MNIDKYLDNRAYTEEGFCYKDREAFENDINAICYISDYDCDEIDYSREIGQDLTDEEMKMSGTAFSRATLRKAIADYYSISVEEVIAKDMDVKVFGALNWEHPGTYLEELDEGDLDE